MDKKLKTKKGGTVIITVILLVILFPIMFSAIIDLSNIYNISKRIKFSLNASTKSASSRVDWMKVPDGNFYLDKEKANDSFENIFKKNLGLIADKDNHKNFKLIFYYTEIYNKYPKEDDYFPKEKHFVKNIQVKVDRPTVFAAATVEYKTLLGKKIYISNFASSQLDFIPNK